MNVIPKISSVIYVCFVSLCCLSTTIDLKANPLLPEDFGFAANPIPQSLPVFVIRYIADESKAEDSYLDQFDGNETLEMFDQRMFREALDGDNFKDTVSGYFAEVSAKRFRIERAAHGISKSVYHVTHSDDENWIFEVRDELLKKADAEINYAQFDRNGDKKIDSSELAVIMVAASTNSGGTVRWLADHCDKPSGGLKLDRVRLCILPAAFGAKSFQSAGGIGIIVHELIHTMENRFERKNRLGDITLSGLGDLYGPSNTLNRLSIMGAFRHKYEGRVYGEIAHPDSVYKMRFGWQRPKTRSLRDNYGCEKLDAYNAAAGVKQTTMLLYGNSHLASEFMLFDPRTRSPRNDVTLPSRYDRFSALAGESGVAVWLTGTDNNGDVRKLEKRPFISTQSPPNNDLNSNSALWTQNDNPISLFWSNGDDIGKRFYINEPSQGQFYVYWQDVNVPAPRAESQHIRDCYERAIGKPVDIKLTEKDTVFYLTKSDGSLVWYRHLGRESGKSFWAHSGNEKIVASGTSQGSGWAAFKQVISADNGILYAIKNDGSLVWYKHDGWQTGDGNWANVGNEKIIASGRGQGSGWAAFKQVISAGKGIFYAIKNDGSLAWYKHEGWQTGGGNWANGGNERIVASGRGQGSGWAAFKQVISAGNGIFYAIKNDGSLVWYKHDGWQTGSGKWASGGIEKIIALGSGRGTGWAAFKQVVSGGNGVLYAIKNDGSLVWYKHDGWQSGSGSWANGGKEKIIATGSGRGSGWAAFNQVVSSVNIMP